MSGTGTPPGFKEVRTEGAVIVSEHLQEEAITGALKRHGVICECGRYPGYEEGKRGPVTSAMLEFLIVGRPRMQEGRAAVPISKQYACGSPACEHTKRLKEECAAYRRVDAWRVPFPPGVEVTPG